MPSLNRVMLMGNLTRDPELRYLPNNTPVVGFGLAMNRRWRNQQGEQQEEVTFVDCEAFGRPAEVINQYIRKGRPIFIEGRLKLDQWQDKEGHNRSKLKVIVETFQFVDSRGGEGGEGDGGEGGGGRPAGGRQYGNRPPRNNAPPPASGGAPAGGNEPPPAVDEDDIPF